MFDVLAPRLHGTPKLEASDTTEGGKTSLQLTSPASVLRNISGTAGENEWASSSGSSDLSAPKLLDDEPGPDDAFLTMGGGDKDADASAVWVGDAANGAKAEASPAAKPVVSAFGDPE